MKKALVTGATGFIGRRLSRALVERGWDVAAAARQGRAPTPIPGVVRVQIADLRENVDWTKALDGVDTVFHLAGKAHDTKAKDPASDYERVNFAATHALLEASRRAGVRRFVFFSSVKAVTAETPYGQSKRKAEQSVIAASDPAMMSTVCLRLSLVYGPEQKGNLARLVRQIDRGLFPALKWADNRRSYVHVDNVVAAALLAAESPKAAGKIYTVSDARPYSTAELCGLIREGLGKNQAWDVPRPMLRTAAALGDVLARLGAPFPLDSETYQKLCGDAFYDCAALRADLGYQPAKDLPGAIPEIIAAYRGTST